jgi:hypothetical protein
MTTITFHSTPASQSTLETWDFMAKSEAKSGKHKYSGAPLDGINPSWKKHGVYSGIQLKLDSRRIICYH